MRNFVGGGDLKESYSLEDLGLNMRITSKWILEIVWDGMDRISLPTYSDKWEYLAELIINSRFL